METLHQHIVALLSEQDRRVEQRFAAMDRAVELAYEQISAWQASQSEWRGVISDRERLMMSRTEIETRQSAQDRRIEALERLASQSQGRQLALPWLIGIAGVLIAAVGLAVSLIVSAG